MQELQSEKKHKEVVLIYDRRCAAALMYKYGLTNITICQDRNGDFATVFALDEAASEALADWQDNDCFTINAKGYFEYCQEIDFELDDILSNFHNEIKFSLNKDNK